MTFADVHAELNRLSKAGRWDDMTGLISDEILNEVAVLGERHEIAGKLRARLAGIADGDHAYFVHSYAAPVDDDCLCSSDHGQRFAAVVQRGNVAGAQFHPERSGAVGARLLKNFIEYGLQ